MYRRVGVCALITLAALTWVPERSAAANKEMQELQRDVAQLAEQVKQLQQSQDRGLIEIRTLVQQALSSSTDANKSVAIIQNGLAQSLRDMESKVVTPVVGLGTRMDQVSSDVRTLQQALADQSAQLSKMQSQLDDLKKAVSVINTTPVAPPQQPGTTASGASETPPIGQSDLYQGALRDFQGTKYEIALQEFNDYLKWYGNTDLAPNAQFYIAEIHKNKGEFETALHEYDVVLEKYTENNKTAAALFGKGQVLVKLGRRTDAAREFNTLATKFPNDALAAQACTQVTNLGFNCTKPASKAQGKKGKKG